MGRGEKGEIGGRVSRDVVGDVQGWYVEGDEVRFTSRSMSMATSKVQGNVER